MVISFQIKKNTMNKKIYITPALQIVKIAISSIIASSPTGGGVNDTQADESSEGFSRIGFWDFDEE